MRSFPPSDRKWQVSSEGGQRPLWRADGRELFYRSASGMLMAATVRADRDFASGPPQPLLPVPPQEFDVAADGRRVLVRVPVEDAPAAPLTVVLDWPALLPR